MTHPFTLDDCNGESLELIAQLYEAGEQIQKDHSRGLYFSKSEYKLAGMPALYRGADECAMWTLYRLKSLSSAQMIEHGLDVMAAQTEIRCAPMRRDPNDDSSTACDVLEAEFFDVYTVMIDASGDTIDGPTVIAPKGHMDIDVSLKTEQAAARYAQGLHELTAWPLDFGLMQ